MESKEQYYTPLDSDFYFGYEYELYEDFDTLPEKSWHKLVYGENGTANPENLTYPFPIKEGKIRTTYLTKQDIESLDWEFMSGSYDWDCIHYKKGNYDLYIYKEEQYIQIYTRFEDSPLSIYKGECKSINELRKIMQWLKI